MPTSWKSASANTATWLVKALQQGYIVDASCHGKFNPDDFLQSALLLADELLLADDQQLTLGEMLSHKVDLRGLRLLILSACQTAVLDLRGAVNEVRSLAAGMLQAGAEAVLASLWSVEDMATYLLIIRFAQEWFPNMEKEPPAAALARAQQWLRTVTNRDLQLWPTMNIPLSTTGEQHQEGLVTPGPKPLINEGQEPFSDKAERFVHALAPRLGDLDACPYADPFYWAGFQVTGW